MWLPELSLFLGGAVYITPASLYQLSRMLSGFTTLPRGKMKSRKNPVEPRGQMLMAGVVMIEASDGFLGSVLLGKHIHLSLSLSLSLWSSHRTRVLRLFTDLVELPPLHVCKMEIRGVLLLNMRRIFRRS